MKKYIGHIVLFFAIVLAIDFGFGKACDYLNAHAKGGATKQMYDLCMKDQYDILIMGSSRAHHHYIPQIIEDSLGMSCYNAGHDGNGIILMYGIYQMILNRYQPKLIIYDVEQAFDLYEYKPDNKCTRYLAEQKPYYNQPGIGQIFKDVAKEEYYKTYSGLCRYNSVSIPLLIDYFTTRPMDSKGYSPLCEEMMKEPEKEGRTEKLVIDSLKFNYIKKLIKDATEKEIPLFVVVSPKYGAENSNTFQPVKEICDTYNIPVLDYYADYQFMMHKEWFEEPMHLNDKGAEVFTRRLVGDISYLHKGF
jgi:hypothetical protein